MTKKFVKIIPFYLLLQCYSSCRFLCLFCPGLYVIRWQMEAVKFYITFLFLWDLNHCISCQCFKSQGTFMSTRNMLKECTEVIFIMRFRWENIICTALNAYYLLVFEEKLCIISILIFFVLFVLTKYFLLHLCVLSSCNCDLNWLQKWGKYRGKKCPAYFTLNRIYKHSKNKNALHTDVTVWLSKTFSFLSLWFIALYLLRCFPLYAFVYNCFIFQGFRKHLFNIFTSLYPKFKRCLKKSL